MLIIILCIWIILWFVAKVWVHDKLSRIIIMFYVYFMGITLIISIINPFNYYPIGLQTYLFVTLASFGFILGFLLLGHGKNYKFAQTQSQKLSDIIKRISQSWIIVLLASISTAFMIPFDILVLTMGSGDQIQYVIQELFAESSSYFIFSYFVFPLKNLCNVTLCYCLIKFKPKYLLLIIIFAAQIISYCIVSGARGDIINFVIYFLIVFISINPSKKLINWTKKKVMALTAMGLLCYFFLIVMTGYRDSGKFDVSYETISEGTTVVNEMVVAYCILPYQLLDIALENDFYTKFEGPYYGKATFAGYFTLIKNTTYKLGFELKTYDNCIKYMNDTWLSISPSEQRNFAYTASFLHYMDFGILGVFFIPLIFGIIFRKLIFMFYRRESFPLFLLVCICFLMMKSSVFISDFIVPYQAFYVALLITWHVYDKYKIHSNFKANLIKERYC
ncbi:MAG: oligosaccharide repeat unit polymerase [Lachnospiraceae bacterium]|nr:oligosaccharide repeat unit polymerase [Lachnospiraceae bacterium]